MKKNYLHVSTSMIAKLVITLMVIMSFVVITPSVAEAATKPTLTKTKSNVYIGNPYNLNVNNKVKKSTYAWSSSDKTIATVNKKGFVKGISEGTATITCKITTPKNTYKLTCKVTIKKGADSVAIRNKVSALTVGQNYNLNRKLLPASSIDKTTWTTSDATIAKPDASGKFTALKEGTVTITCKTRSGASDSVTIQVFDKEGTVKNQEELNTLLAGSADVITIKTTKAVNFVIPEGNYKNTKLVVSAPNSDVTNSGVFSSIEIKEIKSNTWYEKAVGNLLKILAANSRVVISPESKVSIEVTEAGAVLKVENNGVVEELAVQTEADIDISGESDQEIPVVVSVPNITIKTSVPLNLDCKEKITLDLQAGSEGTKVKAATQALVPTVKGTGSVAVTVGTGTAATTTTTTVKNDTVTENPTSGGSTGGSTGGIPGGNITPNYQDYSITSWASLSSITVNYGGQSYTVSGPTLIIVKSFLNAQASTITNWQETTNSTLTYDGVTVNVTGTSGSNSKVVKLTGGNFGTAGKTYTVAISPSTNSVTISSASKTFTVTYINETTMRISPVPATLTFN